MQKGKKVNMKELAKELNVSVATVSKALRDSHEISEQTKKTILEAASRLNYTMNPYASSLRNKKSKTIAVILPEVADNFFSLAINGIQSVAERKAYHVLIYLSHEKFLNEISIVNECNSGRVDGILISVTSETTNAEHIKKLLDENIPVVFFDRKTEDIHAASVTTNDYESGYQAALHLIDNGCHNLAFLSISASLSICNKRADGFKAALIEKNINETGNAIVECRGTNAEVYAQIKKLLTGDNPPDGIVASVERLAMTVYLICNETNVSIPDELKVIVFSTMETAPILNPPLSTITQPAFEIGKTAAELLFKGIEKKKYNLADEAIVLPSVLVARTSSLTS